MNKKDEDTVSETWWRCPYCNKSLYFHRAITISERKDTQQCLICTSCWRLKKVRGDEHKKWGRPGGVRSAP